MHRPAARVICLDASYRLLLLRWRDPADGTSVWGPPGGGMEPGETPLATARRELMEETGLDPAAVLEGSVPVEVDARWNGKHYIGTEQFFLAHFAGDRPPLVRTGLLPYEQDNLDEHAWIPWSDLDSLPHRIVPPRLLSVLEALLPAGPWSDREARNADVGRLESPS
ncbi:NUDIX domain-containing protein [Streptomyces sp. NPDC056883]|uniref:NUDIX domain-containing protein n=1 Tax=Streptomyces sp. NPDC056883 TaxID=3345959 RepID=UPI0036B1C681